jgi:ABC-type nickel/cobalt efflux system permease component RcnA
MNQGPQLLLIGAVAVVGVLHTIVPDHWLPIVLMARQRAWSKAETARVALQAGSGHVLSTLVIAFLVWMAGVAAARRTGAAIDTASSLALIGFGIWVAVSGWREQHHHHGHSHGDRAEKAQDGNAAKGKRRSRTALLLIVGSSPMVEGIPVFFAAGRYGIGLIAVMAAFFAASTIATYVLVCVASAGRLQNFSLGAFERYGEVLSGAAIALVGMAFWVWPFSR